MQIYTTLYFLYLKNFYVYVTIYISINILILDIFNIYMLNVNESQYMNSI